MRDTRPARYREFRKKEKEVMTTENVVGIQTRAMTEAQHMEDGSSKRYGHQPRRSPRCKSNTRTSCIGPSHEPYIRPELNGRYSH